MKKLMTFLFCISLAPSVLASSSVHLDSPNIDVTDQDSLQRGARTYVNYCLGCHSMKYMRYNRMGKDLGLTDAQVESNLMFTAEKVGELITIAMTEADSKKWFGTVPPDLTLTARNRGTDWVYTYLKSFYVDESKPTGMNNIVFPDVAMPHVLAGLQGTQKAVYQEKDGHQAFDKFEMVSAGSLSAEEYDVVVTDLVNFLTYAGDPSQSKRRSLGLYVILFLIGFMVLAKMLKTEYWKDIH
jgi:ubiquinol-cytochrome c reductase cytochrome c1 subunit